MNRHQDDPRNPAFELTATESEQCDGIEGERPSAGLVGAAGALLFKSGAQFTTTALLALAEALDGELGADGAIASSLVRDCAALMAQHEARTC